MKREREVQQHLHYRGCPACISETVLSPDPCLLLFLLPGSVMRREVPHLLWHWDPVALMGESEGQEALMRWQRRPLGPRRVSDAPLTFHQSQRKLSLRV